MKGLVTVVLCGLGFRVGGFIIKLEFLVEMGWKDFEMNVVFNVLN